MKPAESCYLSHYFQIIGPIFTASVHGCDWRTAGKFDSNRLYCSDQSEAFSFTISGAKLNWRLLSRSPEGEVGRLIGLWYILFNIAGFLHVRSVAQGISSDQTETETFKSSGVHFS